MKINTRVRKTEGMIISKRKEKCNIPRGNLKLNKVANYSYLVVHIDEENRQECEVNEKIAKYNFIVEALYPLLKEKYIQRKFKL